MRMAQLKITDFGLAVIRDELYTPPRIPPTPDGSIPLDDVTHHRPDLFRRPRRSPADRQIDQMTDEQESPRDRRLRVGRSNRGRVTSGPQPADHPDGFVARDTLPYMAPEQFRDSKAVDVRADIYAFGVVLFQMLTGELPFHGRTIARLDRAHTKYAPPSVVQSIPKRFAREAEAIDEIVQTCLEEGPGRAVPDDGRTSEGP